VGSVRDQPVADEAAIHAEDGGRTVDVAVGLCGSGARGRPDAPSVVTPDDDLDIRKSTRVDAHNVRARRLRGLTNVIAAVGHVWGGGRGGHGNEEMEDR
jgi:hypothetical protein